MNTGEVTESGSEIGIRIVINTKQYLFTLGDSVGVQTRERLLIGFLIFSLLMSSGASFVINIVPLSTANTVDNVTDAIVRGPVRVDSDTHFGTMASLLGWSGTGSVSNPYIIENYNINASGDGCGIYIGNVTKHFVIRNCTINDTSGNSGTYHKNAGIYLYYSDNGLIFNNTVRRATWNIYLDHSDHCEIVNNTVNVSSTFGIYLYYSFYCNVTGNNVTNTDNEGIRGWDSFYTRTVANTCLWSGQGIVYNDCRYSTLENNICLFNDDGFHINDQDYIKIMNNTCDKNYKGMDLRSGRYWVIKNNSCSNNLDIGMDVDGMQYSKFENNEVLYNNNYGFYIDVGAQNTYANNTILGSDYGIRCESGSNRFLNNTIESSNKNLYLRDYGNNEVGWNKINGTWRSIELDDADMTYIHNNTFTNSSTSIYCDESEDNEIENNTFQDSYRGMEIRYNSAKQYMKDNEFFGCGIDFLIGSPSINYNYIDETNTIDGKPIYYYHQKASLTVPSGAGQIILADSDYITVDNQTISNLTQGLIAYESTNIIIDNCTFYNNEFGTFAYDTDTCVMKNNSYINNQYQHYSYDSINVFMDHNYLSSNSIDTVNIRDSYYHRITNNTFVNTTIHAMASVNLFIENNSFEGSTNGITFVKDGSTRSEGRIINNSINTCETGISIRDCYPQIKRNQLVENHVGINLESISGLSISDNTYSDNNIGIHFSSIESITLKRENFTGCGVYITGQELEWTSHSIDSSNHVNGLPIHYVSNTDNQKIVGDYGQIILASSDNTIVENNSIGSTTAGIQIGHSSNISIINNSINDSYYGICIWSTRKGNISNQNLEDNVQSNLHIQNGRRLTIRNTRSSNSTEGIALYYCINITCINNTLTGEGFFIQGYWIFSHSINESNLVNGKPIIFICNQSGSIVDNDTSQVLIGHCTNMVIRNQTLHDSTVGILISYSNNILIFNNDCSNNNYMGIKLEQSNWVDIRNNTISLNDIYGIFGHGHNNVLINNTVSMNRGYGVYIESPGQWEVYHNDFVANGINAYQSNANTDWDNGSVGNYWSDFSSKYPEATNDGYIWDTAYQLGITYEPRDEFPLVYPVTGDFIKIGSLSLMKAFTGSSFQLRCLVQTNIGVQSVHGLYWFGSDISSATNVSMTDSGGRVYTYSINIPLDDLSPLHINFSVLDENGNWTSTGQIDINVIDNFLPWIVSDGTPTSCESGGDVNFTVDIDDNIAVDSVWLEYWYGIGPTINVSMDPGSGWYYKLTTNQTLDALCYRFHFNDTSGNWNSSSIKNVTMMDVEGLEFFNNTTPVMGYTGDPFTFSIDAKDNIDIDTVWLEYWYGTGTHSNVSMSFLTNTTFAHQIIIDHTLDDLHYVIHGNDTSDNWNASIDRIVAIVDNDLPVPSDMTTGPAATGDPFTFRGRFIDNIAVAEVTVEYWYGTGSSTNHSMSKGTGDNWSYSINISDTLDDLHYRYHLKDGSNNWNHSTSWTLSIVDNDGPTLVSDTTPSSIDLGDTITFSVQASDNIDVASVNISYSRDDGGWSPLALVYGGGVWSGTLSPNSSGIISYKIMIKDSSENQFISDITSISVSAQEPTLPVFLQDNTPSTGTTGEKVTFSISMVDAGNLTNVTVEYWTNATDHVNKTMALQGGSFIQTYTVPSGSVASIHYIFSATFDDVVWNQTSSRSITITDNDPPRAVISALGPYQVGDVLTLVASTSSDNIGITHYKWIVEYGGSGTELYGETAYYTLKNAGNHTISLVVSDAGGLTDLTSTFINVAPLPSNEIEVEVGPVLDETGAPIEGATVDIQFDGIHYTGETDSNGMVDIVLPIEAVDEILDVQIRKEGYQNGTYQPTLSSDGTFDISPPTMIIDEPVDPSDGQNDGNDGSDMTGTIAVIALIVVLVIIIAAIAFFMVQKRKQDEPVFEDDEEDDEEEEELDEEDDEDIDEEDDEDFEDEPEDDDPDDELEDDDLEDEEPEDEVGVEDLDEKDLDDDEDFDDEEEE